MATFTQNDQKDITETLVGRQITDVTENVITLDNGVELEVEANDGCWGCPSGNYRINELNHVENVITAVKVDDKHISDELHEYKIFVYTGGKKNKKGQKHVLLAVSGDDGNGYYGTGYEIAVKSK